jgi:SAM-dependent methyltransferase
LDIACGTGYGTKMFHDAGAESVCGVDISPDAIAHAREHFGAPRAQSMEGDICEFGNENGADLICCFETIEHVLDPVAALRNLRRLLDPAGILVISSPNRPVHAPRLRSIARSAVEPVPRVRVHAARASGSAHRHGLQRRPPDLGPALQSPDASAGTSALRAARPARRQDIRSGAPPTVLGVTSLLRSRRRLSPIKHHPRFRGLYDRGGKLPDGVRDAEVARSEVRATRDPRVPLGLRREVPGPDGNRLQVREGRG